MKPAPFDYVPASTVGEALALLADGGEDAKILAGGQSLLPAMNLRLARPSLLVDIGGVAGLDTLDVNNDAVRIGATTRHHRLETDRTVPGALGQLLRSAGRVIGHLPIRIRGTFGGSLAHADPASEWPLVALAGDARIEAASAARGTRTIAAGDFFRSTFVTALAPDELLASVTFPLPSPTTRGAFTETSRRAGDFAVVACAVLVDAPAGTPERARIALGGVGGRPMRATAAEDALLDRALAGASLDAAAIHQAARAAAAVAAAEVDPRGDVHADAETRRALVAAMVQRAVAEVLTPDGPDTQEAA